MLLESFSYFNLKEKFWLVVGSVADRVMMKVPKHIFQTRNFLEILKTNGFYVSGDSCSFTVVEKNGTKYLLRRGTSDPLVFLQIIIFQEFGNVVNLVQDLGIKINTVIDAGSNIGLTTIYLQKYFPDAQFLCLEPDKGNIKQLELNFEINEVKNVEVLRAGVWSFNGWMDIDYSFGDCLEWARSLKPAKKDAGDVRVYTFNEVLKKKRWDSIDLLKIDIEGAEEAIFSCAEELDFLTKVKVLTIEVHKQFEVGHKVLEVLNKFNFKVYISGELLVGIKRC